MSTLAPRAVVVSRRSELTELLGRHGTRAAAGYFLRQRGRDVSEVEARHEAQQAALDLVGHALPEDWRRGHVDRDDLSRFLFAPEDIVITVGQDGLVANAAKYLTGQQPVIGVNPDPERNPGVLALFAPTALGPSLPALLKRTGVQERVMVLATLDDGQHLVGLNEIYLGHTTHQSARYLLTTPGGQTERHSSSGVLIGTGTGATGWCASVAISRSLESNLPRADEADLCWFVREAWPSPATGVEHTAGRLAAGQSLTITSESEQLVAFADGVESDRLTLTWGQRVTFGVSDHRLRLVVPAG